MSNLSFVGKGQPEVKTRENATLIFQCRVTPDGEHIRECGVGFDIEEFAAARFDKEFARSNGLVPWYAHWKPVLDETGAPLYDIDDHRYVDTDPQNYKSTGGFKPSISSMFRLTYLEQLGMRQSEVYMESILNLPDEKFSQEQKQKLITTSFIVNEESKGYNKMDLHLFEDKTGHVDIHELVKYDLIHVDTVHRTKARERITEYLDECGVDVDDEQVADAAKITQHTENIRVLRIVAAAAETLGIDEATQEKLISEVKSQLTLPQ